MQIIVTGKRQYIAEGRDSATSYVSIPLSDPIPTADYVSGSLVVRVYSLTLTGTSTVAINVKNASVGPDDPGTILAGSSAIATTGNLGTSSSGSVVVAAFTGAIGDHVVPILTFNQTAGAGVTTITMSVELDMRTS